jgi:hypothetical protein
MLEEPTAVVSTVPAAHRGKVLTQGTVLIALTLFVLQLLICVAGALIPAVLGVTTADQIFPDDKETAFIPVLVGWALTAGMMWVLIGQALRHPWSSEYLYGRAMAAFRQREDAIVDLNQLEAMLCEVIPRRNWEHLRLRNAEDLGFLFVDTEKHQLLFEGDNKRYQIPLQAILSSDVEVINKNWEKDKGATPVAVVVVRFQDKDGLSDRELPLRPMRTVGGYAMGGNYVERAEELQRRIYSLALEPQTATA